MWKIARRKAFGSEILRWPRNGCTSRDLTVVLVARALRRAAASFTEDTALFMPKCVLTSDAISADAPLPRTLFGLLQLSPLALFAHTVEMALQLLQGRAVGNRATSIEFWSIG